MLAATRLATVFKVENQHEFCFKSAMGTGRTLVKSIDTVRIDNGRLGDHILQGEP